MWSPNIKIFILDDYESIRTMLKAHIKALGHQGQVLEAADVKNAKLVIEKEAKSGKPVDFILSDWNLPDGTGLEFLVYARSLEAYKNTPILMVTTENETTKIIEALGKGASNYLIKPWTLNDLKDKMLTSWYKHHPEDNPSAVKKVATRRRSI